MKKKYVKIFTLSFFTLLALSITSCIGVGMDIQMNSDGSGRIVLEYKISTMLLNLGGLDGNASMPSIPIDRKDWENTIEGISGLRLVSHSSSTVSDNWIINAILEFDNTESLLKFLDPSCESASITRTNQSGKFNIILWNNNEYDSSSLSLMRTMFDGYNFSVSFTAPGNSAMIVTDGRGNQITSPSSAALAASGRKSSLSIGMYEMISLTDGFGVSFNW